MFTARWLRRAMEAVTILLVCLSPWAFASVHPIFESLVWNGVGLLAIFWAVRILLERRFAPRFDGVSLCLAGIVLLGLWQMTPLARSTLATVSPGTARINAELLPKHAEKLTDGTFPDQAREADKATISVYRYATHEDIVRWVAILLLFLVVRNNIASPAALRRLSVALLINGVLLSYFALAQWFTSPHNMLYWTYPSLGSVFGPFINRNHFAFYMNICIGLSLGLLLHVTASISQVHIPANAYGEMGRAADYSRSRHGPPRLSWHARIGQLLQNPRTLWIVLALVLMLATDVMCLSRGGVLALIAGSAVCVLLSRIRKGQHSRADVIVLVVALMLGLLTWFGFDLAQSRYATLWSGQIPDEGRWRVWNYMLSAVRDFPLWGSGYATFPYVEPLYRNSAEGLDLFWDYAHNEYLQMLIEGGIIGLTLMLLAIVFLYHAAVKALRHYVDRPAAGLVLGAVFALTTVVVHSFVEFGLHMPAITCLVTVVCAQLVGIADAAKQRVAPGEELASASAANASLPQLGGLVPVLAAGT